MRSGTDFLKRRPCLPDVGFRVRHWLVILVLFIIFGLWLRLRVFIFILWLRYRLRLIFVVIVSSLLIRCVVCTFGAVGCPVTPVVADASLVVISGEGRVLRGPGGHLALA